MKKIQTKLLALSIASLLCLAAFAGMMIFAAWAEYSSLSLFQRTSQISQAAYELAKSITDERQASYYAASFLSDRPPQELLTAYQNKVNISKAHLGRLQELAKGDQSVFTPHFREGLSAAIESEVMLNDLRSEILDPVRPQVKDAKSPLKSRALTVYDRILAAQANFLPVLCRETQDVGLVRRIVTQDNIARMQKDLWKIRGLVGSALRDDFLAENAHAELKLKLLSLDDHVSRLRSLSDPLFAKEVQGFLSDQDFVDVVALAAQLRDLGPKATQFKNLAISQEYQSGPSARLEAMFGEFSAAAADGIRSYTAQRLAAARFRFWILFSFCVFAVFGLSGLMYWIVRSITRPLRSVSLRLDETGKNAREASRVIAVSSERLSKDACEQAASLEEISASMEQLTSMNSSNLAQMGKLTAIAERAIQSTAKGRENVGQLTTAMREMQSATKDVASILKTIDGIAFQTNILALNAAVEAARAGEAGAGFSVVAEEVRALAQRSALAARETAEKIETAIRSSAQGADLTRLTETQFAEISRFTQDYHAIIHEVETASTMSTNGLSHVKQSIVRLEQISQRSSATADENAAATVKLREQTETVFQSAERLHAMVRQDPRLGTEKRTVRAAEPVMGDGEPAVASERNRLAGSL
jgi:methyl-accepting chemotaxis protein